MINDALERVNCLLNKIKSLQEAIKNGPGIDVTRDYVDDQIADAYSLIKVETILTSASQSVSQRATTYLTYLTN